MTLQPIGDTAQRDMQRWVDMLAPARQLAEVIAQTEFVPKAMRGKPDVVTAAIMYGDELALGPMQALQGIDVIEGRPRPSAELMRALIFRAGHSIAVHESTGTRCRVSGLRAGRPEGERVSIDWSLDMAKAAGLLGKSNWRAYPRAMLLARATSDLARVLFPDVVKGLGYVAEDDATVATLEAVQVDAPDPEPTKARRQIARKTKPGKHRDDVAPEPMPRHVIDVPLPDDLGPAPESPPEDEPPADDGPAMATVTQLNTLYVKLGVVLGSKTTPDERRAVMADLVGRPLESAKELTREEAYRLRADLMRVGAGLATLARTGADGQWQVVDVATEEPPEDPWADRVDRATGELREGEG